MSWFDLVLLMLASFRLTHLLVFDSIAAPLRAPLEARPFWGDLISCYWCTGFWVSIGLVAGYTIWPAFFYPLVLVLAVAGGAALLETLSQRGE
jgi:hypothetical protein